MKEPCPHCDGLKDTRAEMCNPCRFRLRHPRLGTGNYGIGVTRNAGGYLMNTSTGKYVHREVMERHLGRSLRAKEHVHHKNGDPADNRIENLELLTASEHGRQHMTPAVAKARSALGTRARWGV